MGTGGRLSVTQLVYLVGGLAVAAVFLPRLLGGGASDEAPPPPGEAGIPADGAEYPTLVDPTPFRDDIETIERVLYTERPGAYGDAGAVATSAAELARQLLEMPNRMLAQRTGAELMAFSARVGATEDIGYGAPNLPETRRDWEAVRGSVFRSAPWFKGSAASLTVAQTGQPAAADPRVASALASTADQLETLIRFGRREVAQYGEIPGDARPGSPEARRLLDDFRTWSTRWTTRLNDLLTVLPVLAQVRHSQHLTQARLELYQGMTELNEVGSMFSTYGIPTRRQRGALFERGEHRIGKAREALARARQ